ncbi:hypothetical protein D5086_007942, partial [Populus alba]
MKDDKGNPKNLDRFQIFYRGVHVAGAKFTVSIAKLIGFLVTGLELKFHHLSRFLGFSGQALEGFGYWVGIFRLVMTIPSGSGVPAPMLKGKHKAIVVCWFLGLGSLVSWNSILTIEDYYYDLFPKYHPSRVLTLVYQPFALGTMALLTYNEAKINTRKRNIAGYMLFTASTLMLIVVDLVTSGKGGVGPYIGICAVVAALGVADAHVQGGMVGDLSFMCPEFVQSFFAGLAASGALTSALRLLTKAVFEKSKNGLRKGVILFLVISTFFEFLCILVYAYLFPKLPIVKYYRLKASTEGSNTVSADLAAGGIHINQGDENEAKRHERLSNKELFFENIDYAVDLTLIFVLTLSIVPGFIYEDTGSHQLHS